MLGAIGIASTILGRDNVNVKENKSFVTDPLAKKNKSNNYGLAGFFSPNNDNRLTSGELKGIDDSRVKTGNSFWENIGYFKNSNNNPFGNSPEKSSIFSNSSTIDRLSLAKRALFG